MRSFYYRRVRRGVHVRPGSAAPLQVELGQTRGRQGLNTAFYYLRSKINFNRKAKWLVKLKFSKYEKKTLQQPLYVVSQTIQMAKSHPSLAKLRESICLAIRRPHHSTFHPISLHLPRLEQEGSDGAARERRRLRTVWRRRHGGERHQS